jgi:hypothetical protein
MASQKAQAEADRRNQAEIARLQLEQEKQRAADNEKKRKQEEADRPLIEERQRLARENEAAENKRYEEQKARDEDAARVKAAQAEVVLLCWTDGGLAKVDSGFDYAANFSSFACVA